MKNRKTRLWFFLLLPILSIAAFFLFRSNSQLQHLRITASQPTQQHKKADNVPSLVRDKTDKLHQSVDPWDVWLNDQVEVQTEAFLIAIEAEMPYELMLVKEQINDIKSQIRAAFEREAEKLKANSMEFFEKVTRNEADFEAELERLLTPKLLELPTEERIEAAFHEQFAPQRFQKAVATLQRYGIEEGMRRLRKTDAEIAGHFERVLPSQSRIDSQRKKD